MPTGAPSPAAPPTLTIPLATFVILNATEGGVKSLLHLFQNDRRKAPLNQPQPALRSERTISGPCVVEECE
jgi:hypothetical protein